MADVKLSNNFSLSEFTVSDTAKKLKIDNTPTPEVIENLRLLCQNLLQPLRNKYGKPMSINSGYRTPKLNEAVGGSSTSDHQYGKSADVKVEDPRKLMILLRDMGLAFDQAILYPSFLHLSYRQGGNRRQFLYNGTKPI